MKKLVTLALAGVCALAFAATADAGSALRIKAPTVKQGVTKNVGSANVQVNHVETAYSVYAVNDGTRASQGGYFVVNSIWTDNLLNSQTVYDDIKTSLTKLGSQYSNLFPAVAQEATYVHAAQISSGNAKYNMTTQAAGTGYSSVYNIAHYVIPGRVASLAQGTTEIDMSTENAPNGAAPANSNAKTFENEEAAAKWVNEVRTAFNNQEASNSQSVANKVSALSAIYNSFLADQAATLAAAQKEYDDAVAARQAAQNAYDNAIQERKDAKADYDSKEDVSAFENALTDATNVQNEKQGIYDESVDARIAAEKALEAAIKAEAEALKALQDAEAAQKAAEEDYNAKVAVKNAKVGEAAEALQAEKDAKDVLDKAVAAHEAAQADYDAKVAATKAAAEVLEAAKAEEANALTALNEAKADKEAAQVALDNAKAEIAAFDRAMAEEGLADALHTAREEYDDAHIAVADAKEAQKEAQKEVTSIQDKIDVASEYMTLWNAYAGVRNSHANIGETGIEQLEAVREKAEAVRAFEEEHGLAHSYMLIDGSSHNVSVIMYGDDYPSKTYSYPSKSSNIAPFLGHPDTSELESQLSSANSTVAQAKEAVTAAEKAEATAKAAYAAAKQAYEDGIAALDAEKARLDKAKGDAELALDDAIGAETNAQRAYDAKVSVKDAKAEELAEAQEAEADALVALNEANDAKVAAQTAYDEAKAARVAKDGEVVDAENAEADALAALNAANGVQATAQADYNSAVEVREGKQSDLANAQADEDNALEVLKAAKAAKAAAEKALADAKQARADALALFKNKQQAEASALTSLNNKKQVEARELAELEALKVKQANDNAAKLAELKSQLTSHINSLKYIDDQTGIYGLNYNVNMIDGYDNLRFDQVVYQANAFTEPEYSLSSANKKDDKAIESIVSVSYRQQPYTMVDGVLQQVSYVDINTYETSIYFQSGQKYISPLVLDITGNGQLQASNGQNMPGHDAVKEGNIIGDFFGDGFEIAMEWVGPQDGLLVAPKADGSVDMSCLFGTAGGYENGYEKLSLYDKNGDMKVNGEELNDLAIWQDANGNGIADAGEVKSVKSLGITSINVEFNKENYISSFERNGHTYKMWDWWPNAIELVKVAAK